MRENVFVSLDNTLYIANQTTAVRKGFFRVIQEGRCKIYGHYGYTTDGIATSALFGVLGVLVASASREEGYCIQSGSSDLWMIQPANFGRDMCAFFHKCPHLVEKIKSKQYTIDNWTAMVLDYNNYGCL